MPPSQYTLDTHYRVSTCEVGALIYRCERTARAARTTYPTHYTTTRFTSRTCAPQSIRVSHEYEHNSLMPGLSKLGIR